MIRPGILLLFAVLLNGCSVDEHALTGRWKAAAFYEDGLLSGVPTGDVALEFYPGHRYRFATAGKYEELGSYYISMHYIFFKDTTRFPPLEHVIKVLYLSEDTLKIRMMKDSVEQVLFLAKEIE